MCSIGPTALSERFDAAYYRRYYEDRETRVSEQIQMENLVALVAAWAAHLEIEPVTALDVGCGPGRWKALLEHHYPELEYTGIEVSEYMAEKFGWIHTSVTDYKPEGSFDLVICHDVFQYLNNQDAKKGIRNLGKWAREGLLYFAVLTKEDWEHNVDQRYTDGDAYLRSTRWYRKELAQYFIPLGGSLFVHKRADVVLFELEHG